MGLALFSDGSLQGWAAPCARVGAPELQANEAMHFQFQLLVNSYCTLQMIITEIIRVMRAQCSRVAMLSL